jgi:hypothetical protein
MFFFKFDFVLDYGFSFGLFFGSNQWSLVQFMVEQKVLGQPEMFKIRSKVKTLFR